VPQINSPEDYPKYPGFDMGFAWGPGEKKKWGKSVMTLGY
jgi:hypothetical protein